jgi:hypothetical protein
MVRNYWLDLIELENNFPIGSSVKIIAISQKAIVERYIIGYLLIILVSFDGSLYSAGYDELERCDP